MVNRHAKNQGRRSNGSSVRVVTDRLTDGQTDRWTDSRTDGRYQTYYLPCFAAIKMGGGIHQCIIIFILDLFNLILQEYAVDSNHFSCYMAYFVMLVLEFILHLFADTSALSTQAPNGYYALHEEYQPLLMTKNGIDASCAKTKSGKYAVVSHSSGSVHSQ